MSEITEMSEYTYVMIPCDTTKPMQELRHLRNTCLEDDNLREVLKLRFSNSTLTAEQLRGYVAGLKMQIEEKMPDGGGVSEAQLRSIAGAVSVDTYALTVPSKQAPLAVSLYCDEKGHAKQLPLNSRAIGLAGACGAKSQEFRGDVFVSRYFDDDDAWVREDFTVADCSSDAAWVKAAAEAAATSKSPGGMASLSAMYDQLGAGGQGGAQPLKIDAREEERALMDVEHATDDFKWTQTDADLEIRIPVPPGTKSKDLTVNIKRNALKVALKADAANPKLDVASLKNNVDVDSSTWYIDGDVLIVTLEKAAPGRWDSLD